MHRHFALAIAEKHISKGASEATGKFQGPRDIGENLCKMDSHMIIFTRGTFKGFSRTGAADDELTEDVS